MKCTYNERVVLTTTNAVKRTTDKNTMATLILQMVLACLDISNAVVAAFSKTMESWNAP